MTWTTRSWPATRTSSYFPTKACFCIIVVVVAANYHFLPIADQDLAKTEDAAPVPAKRKVSTSTTTAAPTPHTDIQSRDANNSLGAETGSKDNHQVAPQQQQPKHRPATRGGSEAAVVVTSCAESQGLVIDDDTVNDNLVSSSEDQLTTSSSAGHPNGLEQHQNQLQCGSQELSEVTSDERSTLAATPVRKDIIDEPDYSSYDGGKEHLSVSC